MKNFAAIRKQIEYIANLKCQTYHGIKEQFKINIKGKRSQHYDNRLVAILALLDDNDLKRELPTLKGQMTKAGVNTAKIVTILEKFKEFATFLK